MSFFPSIEVTPLLPTFSVLVSPTSRYPPLRQYYDHVVWFFSEQILRPDVLGFMAAIDDNQNQ